MRILFVTQFFHPENFRINDLALELSERGHDVTVLTGMPNYPEGRFYDGYSMFAPKGESLGDVQIIRVPVIPRRSGALFLCLNYLSFIVTGTAAARRLAADTRDCPYDVIYAFGTSPITQALPAIAYKKKNKTPIVLNVQDLWPDNVVAITGIDNRLVIAMLDRLVDYIYNRCNVIFGTSQSFVDAIKSRKGLKDKRKVAYWPQYSVVEASERLRRDLMPEGKYHIAFTGNVGEGQGLDMVVEAAALIDDTNIVFDIFGDGRAKKRLEELAVCLKVQDKVIFHGSFPEAEIPGILNTADAALLILKDDLIFNRTIPAKMQTYLACKCAIIGCVNGEARRLIEENGVGVCASDQTKEALKDAVLGFVSKSSDEQAAMKNRAYELSRSEFDKEKLIKKLERIFELL